jgi:hypothetical protein
MSKKQRSIGSLAAVRRRYVGAGEICCVGKVKKRKARDAQLSRDRANEIITTTGESEHAYSQTLNTFKDVLM